MAAASRRRPAKIRAPRRAPGRAPARPAPLAPEPPPATPRPVATTTFRLWADQLRALQELAAARRWAQGGRTDHSLVLRELLDAIADTGRIPDGVREALERARSGAGQG